MPPHAAPFLRPPVYYSVSIKNSTNPSDQWYSAEQLELRGGLLDDTRQQCMKEKILYTPCWAGHLLYQQRHPALAIIYYLVAKTNFAIVLTAATLIAFLPQACLGPFAGAVVERHSRKSVMIGADLGIAAAGGILALMALFMELPVWAIMAILFIRSTETAFHSPAFSATTSLIVSTEELTKCAGYTQTIWAVSSIISPAAAFLYSLWPLIAIILLDIAGAVLACITVAISEIPTSNLCAEKKNQQFVQDIKEGNTILRKNLGLSPCFGLASFMYFYMPTSSLYPLLIVSYFKGTPAYAFAAKIAFAFGMLLGGVILSIWGGFKKRRHTIFFSVFLMGVSVTISGCLPPTHLSYLQHAVCVWDLPPCFMGGKMQFSKKESKQSIWGEVFHC